MAGLCYWAMMGSHKFFDELLLNPAHEHTKVQDAPSVVAIPKAKYEVFLRWSIRTSSLSQFC